MKISHIKESFAQIVGKIQNYLVFKQDDTLPEIIAIVRLRQRKGRALYFDALTRLFFELESALVLILIIGALLLLIKEASNFRWLLIFSRQFASQLPPEPISKIMRISTPSSLDYEIIEEPSLTRVLDVIQRNHSSRFSEDVAIFALDRFHAKEDSDVQVVVTLSNQVAITLQGREGKQETLIIVENSKNSGWARLIDYLCERPRGEWISRSTLVLDVYHGVTEAKKVCS